MKKADLWWQIKRNKCCPFTECPPLQLCLKVLSHPHCTSKFFSSRCVRPSYSTKLCPYLLHFKYTVSKITFGLFRLLSLRDPFLPLKRVPLWTSSDLFLQTKSKHLDSFSWFIWTDVQEKTAWLGATSHIPPTSAQAWLAGVSCSITIRAAISSDLLCWIQKQNGFSGEVKFSLI